MGCFMTIADRLHSGFIQFSADIGGALKKIKDIATSPVAVGQLIIGAGLGAGMNKVYFPLTQRILKALGTSPVLASPITSPINGGSLGYKIVMTPVACILFPIMEERMFRGDIQETLKTNFQPFFARFGFSDSAANISARVMSVFFGSVIFGIGHFSNAIFFRCNPILFLPQVVAAITMGLIFGLAKEFSGGLLMPIGMHVTNNTLAWVQYLSTF